MNIRVSVIIVTYNSSPTIENCLNFLNTQTLKDFEVILVDNGSRDHTIEIVESLKSKLNYPLSLVPLGENKGFAGGNNHALGYASGQYIAVLNPDAFAEALWLEKLLDAMEAYPKAGIGASKMIVHGSNTIDSAGVGMSAAHKGFNRGEGTDGGRYGSTEYVFGACGGAAIYRKELLDEIGFFDEDFFLIHEDVDLSFRAQLAGWKVLYVPSAKVQHKVSASIKKLSDIQVYFTIRNSDLMRIKNVPFPLFLRYFLAYFVGVFMEFFYFAVRHNRLTVYLKAKMDVLRFLPVMLKKRGEILNNRKVGNAYIAGIMTPVWQKDYFKNKLGKLFHG